MNLRFSINIVMLLAFLMVLAHDIVPHSHHEEEQEHRQLIYPEHEHESAHFDISDIFSQFRHFGNKPIYTHIIKKVFEGRNNILVKSEPLFDIPGINITSITLSLIPCIRDNPDIPLTEVHRLFLLRAPPILTT
jgi:hypothetical protein